MKSKNSNMLHINALGLKYNPFPVVPDSLNYFTTEEMFSKISDILHCINARKGFILISGEVGLGKTTLSRLLLQKLEIKNINTSLVLNTFLQSGSLLKAINKDFNIHNASDEICDQLDALNGFLLDQYSKEKNCVIVIDDAQQLSLESLELIRQLSNLETNQNKLVQIILVAQSEILDTLNRHDMRQLKSRIALNLSINPFTLHELEEYIDFRLTRAGSSGQISLEKSALKLLHKLSKGYPRQVNLVMDRCLYVVAAYRNNKINKKLIAKAHEEISITSNNKNIFKFNLGWNALAAALIITISFFIYRYQDLIITSIKNTNPDVIASVPNRVKTDAIPINEVNVIDLANVKQTITVPKLVIENKNTSTKSNSNELVYLQQFGLSLLNDVFIKALKSNNFTNFESQLNKKHGYELLIKDTEIFNDNSNEILKYVADSKDYWLTFWMPDITLNAFYQGYYSEQVQQLQSNLQSEGFYRSITDGIVGEKTIIAIAKFQKTVGINASGFPDEITLYQLQKLNQSSIDIGKELQQINEKNKSKNSNKKVNTKPTYSLANNSITTDLE